jgi:biopolymer transport protein ExbD
MKIPTKILTLLTEIMKKGVSTEPGVWVYVDLSGDEVMKIIVKKNKTEIHVNPKEIELEQIGKAFQHLINFHPGEVLARSDKDKKVARVLAILKGKEWNYILARWMKEDKS